MNGSYQFPFAFNFQEELNFASFQSSAENDAALNYLRRFATGRDQFCFLWGRTGSGKTHLLQALCHECQQAVYLPLAQLTDFGPDCLDGLEDLPLLVIDDLQAVAGNRQWEEKLFRLFNAVHEQGGRLCMAADCSPAGLALGLADLKSRLQLSVIFEIRELAEDQRQSLLISRARQRGIELKAEVAAYIMARSERSMQQLTAVLDRLDTLSLAEKRRITIPFVREIFHW